MTESDPKNTVAALTTGNWRRNAVMRQDRHGLLYVRVGKGAQREEGKTRVVYHVSVERVEGEGGRDYNRTFYALEAALRYANGKDGSGFSRYTHAMGRMILKGRGAPLFRAHPAPAAFPAPGMGHPDGYACFLAKVAESILAVSPGMSKHVYTHGINLHPGAEGRRSYGPKSDLPDMITVRCYKSEKEVVAKYFVFPKERSASGLMRVVLAAEHNG